MDAETAILGLLGLVCGLLAYWATRLEGRVDELKENQCRIVEEMHKNYVPREDCRERNGQIDPTGKKCIRRCFRNRG